MIISEHCESLSSPSRWLRASVIHSGYWSPASGPTSNYQTSVPANVEIGRTLQEVNYLKKEEYMKNICNENLKSFSYHFIYCPSHGKLYKLSSTDPGHRLFPLENHCHFPVYLTFPHISIFFWFKILIASLVFFKVLWQELSFCWDKQYSQNSNKWHLHVLIPPTFSLTREYLRGLHISE